MRGVPSNYRTVEQKEARHRNDRLMSFGEITPIQKRFDEEKHERSASLKNGTRRDSQGSGIRNFLIPASLTRRVTCPSPVDESRFNTCLKIS